jgi:hypothetical protein
MVTGRGVNLTDGMVCSVHVMACHVIWREAGTGSDTRVQIPPEG